MTNFKQYLRSHMKSSFRSFIYILVAVIVLSLVIGLSDQPTYDYDPQLEQPVRAYTATLYIPILFMSILAYAIPVMEFSFFKKRINGFLMQSGLEKILQFGEYLVNIRSQLDF